MVRRGSVCATGFRHLAAVIACVSLTATTFLAAAAPVQATLVYTKGWWSTKLLSLWASRDDGSSPHVLVKSSARWLATSAKLSPDGRLVAYNSLTVTGNEPSRVIAMPVAGGRQRVLARNAQLVAWSPDSRRIAVLVVTTHRTRLLTVEVSNGKTWTVAEDWQFLGVSFSPHGRFLAYAAGPERSDLIYKTTSDIYTAAVNGGSVKRLTWDHHCTQPVWGPRSIAFSRWRETRVNGEPVRRQELYLVDPAGGKSRQLTHTGSWSIASVGWSADGRRLVAGRSAQGPGTAVAVNPATGTVRQVGPPGFGAAALSRDGQTILGIIVKGEGYHDVDAVSVPYAGGTPHVLVAQATDPSWDR